MTRKTTRRLAAITAGLALAGGVAACGDDEEESASSGTTSTPAANAELKTGPGVTADKIRLGLLTDSSGVFAGLGIPLTNGSKAFWKVQNANGGVCERQVVLDVKDHGYDPQKAVTQYRQIKDDVLALNQLLGSVMTAALLPSLQEDQMLSVLAGWPSQLAANPNVVVVGATYDLEIINGLDFLIEDGKLKSGDKVGHIYFEGEYGENALAGAKYVAEQEGLTLVEQKIKATDTDMSGQVSAFRREKVKAIVVSAGPRQAASAAGLAAASGLMVPVLGSGPSFDPALLETPAAKALEANMFVSAGTAPYALDAPGVKEATAAYEKAYPKEPAKYSVLAGYAESKIMYEILNKACENKDLTREGLQTALRQLNAVDTGGVVAGTLDYSKLGEPPARASYVSKVKKSAKGGIEPIGEAKVSKNAESYTLAAE